MKAVSAIALGACSGVLALYVTQGAPWYVQGAAVVLLSALVGMAIGRAL